ncbi:uncharacterized protein LOC121256755 [Juglans microcarpa x Juglans regia]|uniref:uncharacterized protein LOC121256755 n=1 Tax=Juglans microcarpa x Juglans regia TaxID=2249226 RepID=UPI001B7DAF8D|nr:uncharacterized protein LOC121256755 [Juglans microcarpa x Juglans regia]
MEEKHKKKFVCKFCNKRYPCGKALGGHIRTHMNQNSAEKEQVVEAHADLVKFPSLDGGKNSKRDSGPETAGWNSSYGLRENPKRTWRFVDSGTGSLQERVCRECGKCFQSLKALCGHMACHSEKEKLISKFEDHSGTSENQKPEMDTQSVTDTSAPRKLRRSKRMRYKTLDTYPSVYSLANGSSSVSEIEQEQEEAAMCLMMFSRDSVCRGGLNSVAESSNNNSVVLEAKSSSIDLKITVKNVGNYVNLKRQSDELKTSDISLSDNSDSGYFRNGPKKAEPDVSVDGSIASGEFKKPKVESGYGTGGFNAELGKSSNRFKFVTSEFGKELIRNEGYGQVGRAFVKCNSRMKSKNDSHSPEFLEGSHKKMKNVCSNIETCKNTQKRSKHECVNRKMCFHSRRAMGPHRASHTQISGCRESVHDRGENNIETDSLPVPKPYSKTVESCGAKTSINRTMPGHSEKRLGTKKSKGHECPICFRVFRSGQALGGHKRSHFFGGSEEGTIVLKQEVPEFHGLIDLNLPAPVEEEANGPAEFMP